MNQKRLVNSFMKMVQIDSLSLKEKKFAMFIAEKLKHLDFEVFFDGAGEKCGGEIGNLYAFKKGDSTKKSVCFCAHLDTVTPGEGIKPILRDDRITSDGTTILASDDKSGIAAILEAIYCIKENDIVHGDLEVLLTIGEERALDGSKNIDIEIIKSKMIYVLDSDGPVGGIINHGPVQTVLEFTVHGKAVHSGVEPEKGISAIQIAAEAISNMNLLRINPGLTANVGYLNAGGPNHIVCDKAFYTAEVRSLKQDDMDQQVAHMINCTEEAASKFGGTCDIKTRVNYPLFNVPESSEIVQLVKSAMDNLKIPMVIKGTGAGSDCNIFNGMGVDTIILATGITNPHALDEYILIEDLCNSALLVEEIVKMA